MHRKLSVSPVLQTEFLSMVEMVKEPEKPSMVF
jgi:hypothetical protein